MLSVTQNKPAFGAAHLSIKSSLAGLAGDVIEEFQLPAHQEVAALVRLTDKAAAKDFQYKQTKAFPGSYYFKSKSGDTIFLQKKPDSINTREYIQIINKDETETLNIKPSEQDQKVTQTLYRKLENALYTLVPISKRK